MFVASELAELDAEEAFGGPVSNLVELTVIGGALDHS
jgi:hypothetical protein